MAVYKVYGIECKLAVDDDRTRSLDMVPRGTRCGGNKVKGVERRMCLAGSPLCSPGQSAHHGNCFCPQVCLDRQCVDASAYGRLEECAKKCNNNGVSVEDDFVSFGGRRATRCLNGGCFALEFLQVCNHKKECHCDPGWAPPHCDIQYADLPQGTGRSSLDHRHTQRNHSSSDSLRAVPSVCPPEN